jgi:hypothetical protein
VTWPAWINAVLSIATARGIVVTVEYPTATWATFRWQCANGTRYGTAAAGAEMIGLTTPEAFTELWVCGPSTIDSRPDARGFGKRVVDRIKARAVAWALEALYKR